MNNDLTYIGLAEGWGGTGCGLEQAGFTGRLAIDINKIACEFHKLNHPGIPVERWDLSKVNPKCIVRKVGRVRLLVITCPCQGISLQGRFDPYHPLNAILIRTIMLIPFIDADAILIENVSAIKYGEMRVLYNIIMNLLGGMKGYNFTEGTLNALHYGVGQTRKRWFCIGLKREIGVPTLPLPDLLGADSCRIINIDPTIEFMKTGYYDENKKHNKATPRTKFNWCYTVTATQNIWTQDDELLTPIQVLKFCGYDPDKWIWDYHSPSLTWKMAGNSVMPPMAAALGRHIKLLLGLS